jgi:hypothetical protein
MKTNIIMFPTGKSLALQVTKRNRTTAILAKNLDKLFDTYLRNIVEIKLYASYITDMLAGDGDVEHVTWCFREALPHDVQMYKLCFVSLSSPTGDDDWSQVDYRRVLSIVTSVDAQVIKGSLLLTKCIDELRIQISKGRGGVDRLYKI